jgi:ubiquinone/menaquinone biosynthesis C-methylase UbiE
MKWLILIIIAFVLFLLDREIYRNEATHLGIKAQAFFYNRWAKNYDKGKGESQKLDVENLAIPLARKLEQKGLDKVVVNVLDFATGTGRFPSALLENDGFDSSVVGVDISIEMLKIAQSKFLDQSELVDFVNYQGGSLPFRSNSFHVVNCLEVLVLITDIDYVLSELYRVLVPGGVIIVSRTTQNRGYDKRLRNMDEFHKVLKDIGFKGIEEKSWWKLFNIVWADKS